MPSMRRLPVAVAADRRVWYSGRVSGESRGSLAGHGRMMQCLQQVLGTAEFSPQCQQQVAARQVIMQTDYRENGELAMACASEVDTLCRAEQVGAVPPRTQSPPSFHAAW